MQGLDLKANNIVLTSVRTSLYHFFVKNTCAIWFTSLRQRLSIVTFALNNKFRAILTLFCQCNFPYFIILHVWLLGKKEWPFLWTNLISLHPIMLCAKFCWSWPCSSGEIFFLQNFSSVLLPFIYLSMGKVVALYLNKPKAPPSYISKNVNVCV